MDSEIAVTAQEIIIIRLATEILVDNVNTLNDYLQALLISAESLVGALMASPQASGRLLDELCCLCRERVPFIAGLASHSQCPSCGMILDRCCLTLRLAVPADSHATSIGGEERIEDDVNRLFQCPCCSSIANRSELDSLITRIRSLELPRDVCPLDAFPWTRISTAICPFCSILMSRI